MVVIRLARGGAKKAPFYHVVIANKQSPRDGRFIERVGYFNPMARGNEARLLLQKERLSYWIQQGAQPSERVAYLIKAFDNQATEAKPLPTKAEIKKAQAEAAEKAAKKAAEAAAKAEAESKAAEKAVAAEPKEEKSSDKE